MTSKFLVIALSGIGDALMFTPSLVKLKENLPDSQIDVLIMYKGVQEIYERLPQVSNIHYFDFLNSNPLKAIKFIFKLRKNYSTSINVYPSNRWEYNLISLLIGAKERAGVRYKRKNFQNFGFMNNITINENDDLHNVEENIGLCEKILRKRLVEIPDLQFPLNDEDIDFAENYLKNKNILSEELVIGIHPGCSTLKNHIKRRWEPEKFATLSKKLIEDVGAKILIFGGEDERELKENVLKDISDNNALAVNADNLSHTAAIMKRCNVFVTNDSSLMHIAASQKLNVVAIIGPTSVNYIHPWKTNYKIVSLNLDCAPCFYYSPRPLTCTRKDVKFKCIKELEVDMVFKAVNNFLLNGN